MRIVVTAKRSAGLNTFLNFATIKEVFTNTGKMMWLTREVFLNIKGFI